MTTSAIRAVDWGDGTELFEKVSVSRHNLRREDAELVEKHDWYPIAATGEPIFRVDTCLKSS